MTATSHTHPRRSRVIRALLSCGIAVGLASVGTLATWTTGDSVTPGELTSSQLDLVVNGELATVSNLDGTHVESAWTIDELIAGETVAVTFSVTNGGVSEMPLDVRIDTYVTGGLRQGLSLEFYEGGTPSESVSLTDPATDEYRQVTCSGGTSVSGTLDPGDSLATATPVVTDKQRLNVGDSQSYCMRVVTKTGATYDNNTDHLNKQATVVVVVRGTQDGAP